MKANEAPKKIYLTPLECMAASCQPQKDNTVEYTRTDAFIEKAEKYLIGKFINDVSVLNGEVVGINFDAAISNFVKYMKGE